MRVTDDSECHVTRTTVDRLGTGNWGGVEGVNVEATEAAATQIIDNAAPACGSVIWATGELQACLTHAAEVQQWVEQYADPPPSDLAELAGLLWRETHGEYTDATFVVWRDDD